MLSLLPLLLLSSLWPWTMAGVQAATTNDAFMMDTFHQIQLSTGVNPLLSNGYLVFYNQFTETVVYEQADPLSGDSKVLTVSPLSIGSGDHHHWWRFVRAATGYFNIVAVEGEASEVAVCTGGDSSTPVVLCSWTDSAVSHFYLMESSSNAFVGSQSLGGCLTALGGNASLSSVLCDYGDPKQQWLLCNPSSTDQCWPHNKPLQQLNPLQ